MSSRCNAVTGRERFGDDKEHWTEVRCLLPSGHDGPHADWSAWLGVKNPDFSAPGKARVAAASETKRDAGFVPVKENK